MNAAYESEALYDISARLIANHANWFPKIGAHEPDDPEGCDLLWISTAENDMTEGEVITLSPLSGGRWYAAHDYANKYGGWPTVWDFAGGADEVINTVVSYLETEMASVQARR